jgi:hypothetical protein
MTKISRREALKTGGKAIASLPVVKAGAVIAGGVALTGLASACRASEPDTWVNYPGGVMPGPTEALIVNSALLPNGLLLDLPFFEWASIDVAANSRVSMDRWRDVKVKLHGNYVNRGELFMWPTSRTNNHELCFVDIDEAAMHGGGNEVFDEDVGLWNVDGGKLHLQGPEVTDMVFPTLGLAANQTVITLASIPVGWQVGDSIVIAPTESGQNSHLPYDETTIAAINGTTLTLADALVNDHPTWLINGQLQRPEILNTTRSVKIYGEEDGRTHIFSNNIVAHTLEYFEVFNFGPRKLGDFVQGRYGIHFHHGGTYATQQVVKGASIHHGGSHAFVTHKTHNIKLSHCVAHASQEEQYWWDTSGQGIDNATHDILWHDCIGSMALEGTGDIQLAIFAVGKGDRCEVVRCRAFGGRGGKKSSAYRWGEKQAPVLGPWVFIDNVAHNMQELGVFWWQNNPHPSTIINTVFYNCGGGGILTGAYGNGLLATGVTTVNSGDAGLIIHAASTFDQGAGEVRQQTYTACVFDGVIKEPGSLPPPIDPVTLEEVPNLFVNCVIGPAPSGKAIELLHRNNVDEKDLLEFNEMTTFPGVLEDDLIIIEDGSHIDLQITVWFNGTHWQVNSKDSGIGVFYGPWNANRTDIT